MSLQESVEIDCPYCGEPVMLLIDCSAGAQQYVEDCQVCCRPMVVRVTLDESGYPQVAVGRDDE